MRCGPVMEDTCLVAAAGTDLHRGGREGVEHKTTARLHPHHVSALVVSVEVITVDLQSWLIGDLSPRVVCGISSPRS
jgi:hypothetical protein